MLIRRKQCCDAGDVTRIVSMNNKERRSLIDELAGVALLIAELNKHIRNLMMFLKDKKDEILENELQSSKIKLEKECEKAKKYKEFKAKLFT